MTGRQRTKVVMLNNPLVVGSAEFKSWFRGSTVTDQNRNPKAMYHGTYLDFDSFDATYDFHCFACDPLLAEEQARQSYSSFRTESRAAAIVVMPVYLRVLRPFDPRTSECERLMRDWGLGDPTLYDYGEWESLEFPEVTARIKSLGFDGIWTRHTSQYDMLNVFDPRQIKSAIGNSGRFDLRTASLTDPTPALAA
jgi:hypothetical protein